jgi:hypothetical protein
MRHYTEYLVAFIFLPECVARLRRNLGLPPLTGGFGEHLDGGCPNHLASERRGLNAALDGNMSAQKLGSTELMHLLLCTT